MNACRRLVLASLLIAVLPAAQAADTPLTANHGWVRLLPGSLPAGGYFTLKNKSDHTVKLTGASSPAYGSVMLHHSLQSQGQSRMVMVDSVPVPAHGQLSFAPGGYHLMLIQPRAALKTGGHIDITLSFSDGEKLTVPFALRPAGASGP